jgi:hypothetical protein
MSDDSEGVITLHDGTRISTRTGRPVRDNPQRPPPGYIALPSNAEAVREVTRVRKRLADLPDIPSRMNVIGAVAAYHLFGLDAHEIAFAIGATERQVGNLMMTDAYNALVTSMQQNIVETQQEDVRALIAANARDAVHTVVTAMRSENEQVAVVAAKDILDRAGHRPADVVEHRHRIEGGLTIEYVRKGEHDDDLPVIDMNVEDQ